MLRWWDYWLKGIDTGVMDEPSLRAWMMESVKPASHNEALPGRWIAEPSWPPSGIKPRRLFLTDEGLRDATAAVDGSRGVLAADGRQVCRQLGSIRPCARSGRRPARRRHALARFSRHRHSIRRSSCSARRSSRSMSRPTGRLRTWRFGYAMCTRRANCCVSAYGVLNLTHRDGHEKPALMADRRTLPGAYPAQRCGLGIPGRPQGEARVIDGLLADDLATVRRRQRCQIMGGTLDLPVRPRAEPRTRRSSPLPEPESAPPEKPTRMRRGDVRIERIDRIGLELGTEGQLAVSCRGG